MSADIASAKTEEAKRILIVDDDPDAAAFLTRLLESRGYRTWTLNDPLEAVAACSTVKPHLVILDFDMPGLLGSELCVQLKSTGGLARIPVVFVSGMTGESFREIASFTGAVAYLDKPVDSAKLLETVGTLTAFPSVDERPGASRERRS